MATLFIPRSSEHPAKARITTTTTTVSFSLQKTRRFMIYSARLCVAKHKYHRLCLSSFPVVLIKPRCVASHRTTFKPGATTENFYIAQGAILELISTWLLHNFYHGHHHHFHRLWWLQLYHLCKVTQIAGCYEICRRLPRFFSVDFQKPT